MGITKTGGLDGFAKRIVTSEKSPATDEQKLFLTKIGQVMKGQQPDATTPAVLDR